MRQGRGRQAGSSAPGSPGVPGKAASPWALPLAILAAAAFLRGLFLLYPPMDSDQATTGLMALSILRGDFPVFFFGQDHCGSIEAFVAAPLFALFGASRHTLNLAPALISLGFIWVVFLAAKDLWGRRAGIWAMLFAAFPPFYFMWHNVLPRAAYIEIPLFAVLLAWLTFRLAHGRRRPLDYFFWGLVAGAGWWTHPMMIYALAPCGLYLATAGWRALFSPWLLLMALGAALGGAPFWYYNLANDWASFRYLAGAKPGGLPFWRAFLGFFERPLPVVLGVYKDWVRQPVIPLVSYLVWALGMAAPLYLLWKRKAALLDLARFSGREADGSEIFILMAGTVLAVAAVGGESPDGSVRHLVPIYAAIIPLAGYLASRLAEKNPRLAWILAGLALASNLYGSLALANFMDPAARAGQREEVANAQKLADFCNQRGIKYAYAHGYWQAPKLTFDTGERLVLVAPGEDRHAPYTNGLLAAANPAVVAGPGNETDSVRMSLSLLRARWKEGSAGGMRIFYDIKKPEQAAPFLRPERFGGSGRPNREDVAQTWDLNASTRWFSLGPQKPGQSLTLDLGRDVEGVSRLLLFAGLGTDQPVGLKIEGSRDGKRWLPLASYRDMWWPMVWAPDKPMVLTAPAWQEIRFDPTTLRYLRLRGTGETRVWNWTVIEALVGAGRPGQAEPSRPNPAEAAAWIASRVKQGPVAADPWLSAHLPRDLRWRPARAKRPAWLREYLYPRFLLPAKEPVTMAVRDEFAPLALAALKSANWRATAESRLGVTLIQARPVPERPRPKLLAEGLRPTKQGGDLLLDLGQTRRVGELVFHGDNYSFLTPDALTLAARTADGRYLPVPFRFHWPGRLYWSGLFPLAAKPYPVSLELPAVTARYLRLRKAIPQGGALPGILRVDVYAPAGE